MASSRFLARVGILAVALSLTACGDDQSDEVEKVRQNTSEASFNALTAGNGMSCALDDGSTLAFDSDGNMYVNGGGEPLKTYGMRSAWDYEVTRSLLSSLGYTYPNGMRQYITTMDIPGGLNMNVRTQELDGSGNVRGESTATGNCAALRGEVLPYAPADAVTVLDGMTCSNHVRPQTFVFGANKVNVLEQGQVVAQEYAASLFDGTGVQLKSTRLQAIAFVLGDGYGTYLDVRDSSIGETHRFPCGR